VGRLARLSFGGADGEALATFGSVEISHRRTSMPSRCAIASPSAATPAVGGGPRRGEASNARFVDKAPADVVEAEQAKLARYQAELEELLP
jgi:hypothetical protein